MPDFSGQTRINSVAQENQHEGGGFMMSETRRDHYAGALVALIGAGAAWQGSQYGIGTMTRMGAGFFPTALGVGMVVMGVLIAASAGKTQSVGIAPLHGPETAPDWRGWAAIIAAVLAFIGLAQYAGLLPATFACVFVAAMGDREASWRQSAALAAGITVFGIVLFNYVLQVQIPIIGQMF
jgi:Tripartite tricarboxylate transporter TctB family